MHLLVTGTAGFIGFHTAKRLLERGDSVVGFDVVNAYYDVGIKEARLRLLEETARKTGSSYQFLRANLADRTVVNDCFKAHAFDRVIHLAAQAGVRYSLENPHAYVESNIIAFTNIIEACRHAATPHLTYASTSSVYGANTTLPFSEHAGVDHPLQFYAATKRANELMAHSYSHLFRLPTTGLRFFTAYGPWGRPDMALFLFTRSILAGQPIKVFNHGHHSRDFTYVDDIAEGIIRTSDTIAQPNPLWDSNAPDPATSNAPFRLFNIGNNTPIQLSAYIAALEDALGKKAIKELLPLQPGDVPNSSADTSELQKYAAYKPTTSVLQGVGNFRSVVPGVFSGLKTMNAIEEVRSGGRFEFGKNWSGFLSVLTDERIALAEASLKKMLCLDSLTGLSFLDIGSGSGLFSLAARRLGARVHSLDYDPHSVACTEELRRRYFSGDPQWTIGLGSALDKAYLESLGQFDIVYSWGVLHHTGAMWQALDNVAGCIKPGGRLFISLYNDQGRWSKGWLAVKKLYNRLPNFAKTPYVLLITGFMELKRLARHALTLNFKGYLTYITQYQSKSVRGMSWWHDRVDWIGGYPFEVSTPEQIFEFYYTRGFQLLALKTCGGGLGCNEFVFRKTEGLDSQGKPDPLMGNCVA